MAQITEDAFKFEDWTRDFKLNRDTTKILSTQSMTDHECLVSVDLEDLKSTGIAVGQLVMMRKALAALGNVNFAPRTPSVTVPTEQEAEDNSEEFTDATENQAPTNESEALLTAGKELDALLANGASGLSLGSPIASSRTPSVPQHVTSEYDPRVLLTNKATTKKAVKITEFLPEQVKERLQRRRRDRMVFTQGADGSLAVKAPEEDTWSITWMEWSAANMRLFHHLLDTGLLQRSHVEYYLAYTMQVYELADTYDWASIVQFDSRYRDLQAQHGFMWGDMRLALQMQILTPKQSHQVRGPYQPRRGQGYQAPAVQEDCKKWLTSGFKFCPFGQKCRFRHKKMEQPEDRAAKNDRAQDSQ